MCICITFLVFAIKQTAGGYGAAKLIIAAKNAYDEGDYNKAALKMVQFAAKMDGN